MADLSGAEVFKQVRAKKLKKSAEQVLFERAVGAAWLAHQRGFPVEAQTIYEQDRSLNVSVLQGLLGTEKFQNALVERGIPLETPIGVTAEQLYALSVMTDQSLGLDPFARLKRLGVSWAVWQGWLKQPLFARLYSKHAEDMLRSSIPAALTALSSRAQAGDNNSIKFLLAVTGYYDPAARSQSGEYMRVISAMLDAVERYVDDPEALRKIAASVSESASRWNVPLAIEDAEIVEE